MYTSFEIGAVIICLLSLVYSLTMRREVYAVKESLFKSLVNSHITFIILNVILLCSACFSQAEIYFEQHSPDFQIQMFLNILFMLAHTSLPVFYALYIMNIYGGVFGKPPLFFTGFFLPYLIEQVLIFTNPLTRMLFTFDGQMRYIRGPMMPALYVASLFYGLIGSLYFIRFRKAVTRRTRVSFAFFLVFAMCGTIIQLFRPDLLVECFAQAICFVGFMLTVENEEARIDDRSQAFSRVSFTLENERLISAESNYLVMCIRIGDLDLLPRFFPERDVTALIRQITAYLMSLTRRDRTFIVGSSCYSLILDGMPNAYVRDLVERISDRFDRPWQCGAREVTLKTLVSTIHIPDDAGTADSLNKLIDASIRTGMERDGETDDRDLKRAKRHIYVEQSLQQAIFGRHIEVWYQPIVDAGDGQVIAAEALCRIRDDEGKLISPEEFIPIAEQNGMIWDLGLDVLEQVCAFIAKTGIGMKRQDIRYIEVNLSPYQFLYRDLVPSILEIMEKNKIPPSSLNLEITESETVTGQKRQKELIRELRQNGCTFSLDDYGSAYSNAVRLLEKDFINIKIDKSLLWTADSDPAAERLLLHTIASIREMGYNVIQEGVESREHLEKVRNYGANLIQGYFFSKPLPENEFLDLLKEAPLSI